MTDTKKIELAGSDLAAAVAELAEYRAAKIVNERMETWHNVAQGLVQKDHDLAQRVQKLENAGSRVEQLDHDVADELRATHDELRAMNRCISAIQEQLDRADRRIADLEMALDDRMEELEGEINAKHRLIEKLEERTDDLDRDVRNTADTTRNTIADMINDGDLYLTVM